MSIPSFCLKGSFSALLIFLVFCEYGFYSLRVYRWSHMPLPHPKAESTGGTDPNTRLLLSLSCQNDLQKCYLED